MTRPYAAGVVIWSLAITTSEVCGPSMLPFGLLDVALASAVRTSSSVMPMLASLPGSICTRIAGFCWPPIATWPTPLTVESCCTRMFSA